MLSALNNYQRIRRLAVGGMGEIFLARKGSSGDELAILKTLLVPPEDDGSAVQMFREEARVTMLLKHPNIVQVYEIFDDAGQPVLAMEYIDGESLAVLLRAANSKKRHELAPFVEAVAQAALGLHAAHTARDAKGRPMNLAHRDVSPQNIMATAQRRDGCPLGKRLQTSRAPARKAP